LDPRTCGSLVFREPHMSRPLPTHGAPAHRSHAAHRWYVGWDASNARRSLRTMPATSPMVLAKHRRAEWDEVHRSCSIDGAFRQSIECRPQMALEKNKKRVQSSKTGTVTVLAKYELRLHPLLLAFVVSCCPYRSCADSAPSTALSANRSNAAHRWRLRRIRSGYNRRRPGRSRCWQRPGVVVVRRCRLSS
jgi:hypothetical protein